jgi:hypothetical protein
MQDLIKFGNTSKENYCTIATFLKTAGYDLQDEEKEVLILSKRILRSSNKINNATLRDLDRLRQARYSTFSERLYFILCPIVRDIGMQLLDNLSTSGDLHLIRESIKISLEVLMVIQQHNKTACTSEIISRLKDDYATVNRMIYFVNRYPPDIALLRYRGL